DSLLVRQHADRTGPVGAPHAAVEAERVEDAGERIPDVLVREWLVRQRAGAGDLHRDVGIWRERQQLRQIGPRLRRRGWLARLRQAEMADHQLRVWIARCELSDLL